MRGLGRLIWSMLLVLLRPRAALAAENLVLRQINVLRRTAPKRPLLSNVDRLIFVCLYRLFPGVRNVLAIVKPETIIRWHRWGFRAYWRWRSRVRGGRPKVPLEIRRVDPRDQLCQRALGCASDPRRAPQARYRADERGEIHGAEEATAFLRNHADGIAAMDLFVVRTVSFRLARWSLGASGPRESEIDRYRHDHLGRTLVRNSDRLGPPRVRRPCCRVRRTAPLPPVARVQELLQRDAHAPVLEQDAPSSRAVQATGHIISLPILSGLHHQYCRI
jgi:hypothetical protein